MALKKLSRGWWGSGGRNNRGRITINHRGGGVKQKYRMIDLKRGLWNIKAMLISVEKDPQRSADLALILYVNGFLSYILYPVGLQKEVLISAGLHAEIYPGNALPLWRIPLGTHIHNIELMPGKGGQLIRSAGTFGVLLKLDQSPHAVVKLPSGEHRKILKLCMATVGRISPTNHYLKVIGKAGTSRLLNIRPIVRGVAKNPVDHPHGGDTSGGRPSVTPWGRLTKGYPTRSKRKNKTFVIKNRKIYD